MQFCDPGHGTSPDSGEEVSPIREQSFLRDEKGLTIALYTFDPVGGVLF